MTTNRRKRLAWPRRTGFWYRTHAGNTAHIQGDPNMNEEALSALEALIDAAHRAIKSGAFDARSLSHNNPHEHSSQEATDD